MSKMSTKTGITMEPSRPAAMRPVASVARDKALFTDSLLDSTVRQRARRTWSTILSFVLEFVVVGFVLLLPLWFTEALPKQQLLTLLEAPPPPPPPPPAAAPTPRVKVVKVTSNIAEGRLRTPTRIPAKVQVIKEDDAPPPDTTAAGVVGGVPGGIAGGQLNGVIGGIIGSSANVAAAPTLPKPAPTPQRVRLSQGVVQGLLINRIEPTYPPVARDAHIQGAVVLTAIIGKDGSILRLQVISGNPLLAPAAIGAVKQWRYKPYVLNGQPIEVETTVTVTFRVRT
jgi:periplasmic protein TonB